MVVTKKMRQSSRRRNVEGFKGTRMNSCSNKYAGVKQMNSIRQRANALLSAMGFSKYVKGDR